ncbi:MAG: PH domain-containing protein [Candidatus Saccharimonadales bacterium]|nr:PH domain-containing protein [Candidatus Saccharimonadales bacterium]
MGRAEIKQLPHILFPDETIHRIVTGGCPDGIAVLAATNKRLLLVDKSPFTLDVEDFPYEYISNAEHHLGFVFGTMKIHTLNRELVFQRVNPRKISPFAKFVYFKIREASEHVRRLTRAIDPQNMTGHTVPFPGGNQPARSHMNTFWGGSGYRQQQ